VISPYVLSCKIVCLEISSFNLLISKLKNSDLVHPVLISSISVFITAILSVTSYLVEYAPLIPVTSVDTV